MIRSDDPGGSARGAQPALRDRALFSIAAETQREFGTMLTFVRAAEMLNLVDTPRRMVALEPLGKVSEH